MDMDTLLLPSPPATPPLRDNKVENVSQERENRNDSQTESQTAEIDLQFASLTVRPNECSVYVCVCVC